MMPALAESFQTKAKADLDASTLLLVALLAIHGGKIPISPEKDVSWRRQDLNCLLGYWLGTFRTLSF